MKNDLKWAAILILGIVAGCSMLCAIANKRQAAELRAERSDTIRVVIYDTVRVVSPSPVAVTALPYAVKRLPMTTRNVDNLVRDYNNLSSHAAEVDSVEVTVPMQRKVFTDSATYRAVVSGAWVAIDTIDVYPRREVVTISQPPEKPKRWSVGVAVGYGLTPHGLQPFAGLTLSYSLWRF